MRGNVAEKTVEIFPRITAETRMSYREWVRRHNKRCKWVMCSDPNCNWESPPYAEFCTHCKAGLDRSFLLVPTERRKYEVQEIQHKLEKQLDLVGRGSSSWRPQQMRREFQDALSVLSELIEDGEELVRAEESLRDILQGKLSEFGLNR